MTDSNFDGQDLPGGKSRSQRSETGREPLLVVRGLSKSYSGVQALRNADFTVRSGEVHCFLGENGAGKSTLVKLLAGAVSADDGTVHFKGESLAGLNPKEVRDRGVSVIYQELELLLDMTVEQNLYLANEPRLGPLIDRRTRRTHAQKVLDTLDAAIDPRTLVRNLSLGQKQLVALAKALTTEASLIIMDEPSAALEQAELDTLLRTIRRLTDQGRAIIYISHRFNEIREVGHRATVLRDGGTVTTVDLSAVTNDDLVKYMIGSAKPLVERLTRRAIDNALKPKLHIETIDIPGAISISNIQVRPGEILGLAGLVGSGRTTFLKSLFGGTSARIVAKLDDLPFKPGRPRDAIHRRVALVPEDRKASGVALDLSIEQNIAMPSLRKWSSLGFRDVARSRRESLSMIERLDIRCKGPSQHARHLSGGNQQKVVLGKWLAKGAELLLLDEPTRGLDLGAKAALWAEVSRLSEEGLTVIAASSELEELLDNCDRIIVLHEGKNVAEFPADISNRDAILTTSIQGAE